MHVQFLFFLGHAIPTPVPVRQEQQPPPRVATLSLRQEQPWEMKCIRSVCNSPVWGAKKCATKKNACATKKRCMCSKKPNTKSACAMKSRKGGAACAKKREGKEALHVQRKKMHSDMAALHWKAFVKLTRKYWLHCRSRNLSRGTTRTTLKPNM